MNFQKSILIFTIHSLQKGIIYLFFLNFLYFSSSVIITGKYPIIKRLNNGNYVIASITNITFEDSTLSTIIKTRDIVFNITQQDEIGSSTVAQFPAEHNGYVLVIIYKTLYFFSSTGEYISEKLTSIEKQKFPSFIIPNGSSGNDYKFAVIYCSDGLFEDSPYISFEKGNFNSATNEITFSEVINFQPLDGCIHSVISYVN